MSLPKFLTPERPAFASIEVVPVVTHYCEYDRIQRHGRSIGLCGNWVEPAQLQAEPTCPECRRLLAITAEEMFGEATNSPTVRSPRTDDHYFEYATRLARQDHGTK